MDDPVHILIVLVFDYVIYSSAPTDMPLTHTICKFSSQFIVVIILGVEPFDSDTLLSLQIYK